MAMIRAKDSNGTWMPVATATSLTIDNGPRGEFKSVNIEVPYGTETNTLNLSGYVTGSNDFFIILGVTTSKNGSEELFAWWRSEGKTRKIVNTLPYGQHANLNGIFPVNTSVEFSYDEATGILTLSDDTYKFIENALLFYVDVKEA